MVCQIFGADSLEPGFGTQLWGGCSSKNPDSTKKGQRKRTARVTKQVKARIGQIGISRVGCSIQGLEFMMVPLFRLTPGSIGCINMDIGLPTVAMLWSHQCPD